MKKYFYRIGCLLLLLYLPAALLGLWSAARVWGHSGFMEYLNQAVNPWLWAGWLLQLAFGALYLAPWLLLFCVLPVYLLIFAWIDRPTRLKAIIFIALSPLVNPFQTIIPATPFLLHSILH